MLKADELLCLFNVAMNTQRAIVKVLSRGNRRKICANAFRCGYGDAAGKRRTVYAKKKKTVKLTRFNQQLSSRV